MESYGYRFDTADRSIVITGDTAPPRQRSRVQRMRCPHPRGQYALALAARPAMFQALRGMYHTSTVQLAELAAQAKPKLLVLYPPRFRSDRG
jgi:ribonuclease BN (tRNA processing enzyme)